MCTTKQKIALLALAVVLAVGCSEDKKPGQGGAAQGTTELQIGDTTVHVSVPTQKEEMEKQLENDVLMQTDKLPQFPGGFDAERKWIRQHVVYPEAARKSKLEGRVIVSVHIDTKGRLSNHAIFETDNVLFNDAALNVVRKMPRWTPAMKNGKPVAVDFKIMVPFRL